MANETVPQYRLPEKQWFTLQQVADRWTEKTGKKVSPEDVLHYGETGELEICYRFELAAVAWHVQVNDEDGGFDISDILRATEPGNLLRLSRGDLGKLSRTGSVIPFLLYPPRGESFHQINREYDGMFVFGTVRTAHNKPLVDTVDFSHKDRLVITREELHRFEQAHDLGQPVPSETVALTGKLTPELWKDFTPEQKGEQAVRRYKELESNYEAVGREVGVTGACIKIHVKKHNERNKRTPSEKPNPPSVPSEWNTTLSK